jgi:hypothetical protein
MLRAHLDEGVARRRDGSSFRLWQPPLHRSLAPSRYWDFAGCTTQGAGESKFDQGARRKPEAEGHCASANAKRYPQAGPGVSKSAVEAELSFNLAEVARQLNISQLL